MIRLLFLAIILIATPASAQRICGPTNQVVQGLAESFGEFPVWDGLSNRGYRVVVTTNADTGKFTILKVYANGIACFAEVGEAAHMTLPPQQGDGA